MKKYALILGCNMPALRPDIERAIRLTMPQLGIDLLDLEGAVCCSGFGAFPSADEIASLAVNAWNLSIAEEKGVDILTECGSCFGSPNLGRDKLLHDSNKKEKVGELLKKAGKKYEGRARVRHMIDVLHNEVGVEKINGAITKNLKGINAIVQYPCHTLFPSKIVGFDDPGRPQMLRRITEALGANVREYSLEYRCCGGSGGFHRRSHIEAVIYTQKKLDAIIEETDAELIVVSCITCCLHLDGTQKELNEKSDGNKYSLPVFDYSQLLALCMGFKAKEVAAISFIPKDKIIGRI